MQKLDVAIIDYKISNMFSVMSACNFFGLNVDIVNGREQILNARAAILPGVGTFSAGMYHLKELQLEEVISEFISSGKPFMGICLGMQLLMSDSEEFGYHKGLDLIKGSVKKLPLMNEKSEKIRIPNIGWEKISIKKQGDDNIWPKSAVKDIPDDELMYFVHSFFVTPTDTQIVTTETNYEGFKFCSSIAFQNIFASQFHPEKSGKVGLTIFRNFSEAVRGTID